MRILLDTNTYSSYLTQDEMVMEYLERADTIFVSTIVIGELLAGYKRGSKKIENKERLHTFLEKPGVAIINVSKETSEVYAQIQFELAQKGKPIPSNDAWIAAHALETGSVLVTYDRHFLKIPGLRLWDELRLGN